MEYKKILNKLINNSFPKLKNKKIRVIKFRILKGYGFCIPIINFIGITKEYENFSDKEKIGLWVHELSHAEQFNKWGFFKNIFMFISYWFSKKTRKRIEVQTDKLAIKKGYAKELFEVTKRFEKEFGRTRKGLSVKQIRPYLKIRKSP